MNSLFPRPSDKITFPTNYDSIIERLDKIDPVQYGKTRNFTDGAVTYLSPYISRGVISVNQVAVLAKGYSSYSIEKFLQELAWREYFQRVWQAKGESIFQDMKQPQSDVVHYHMIRAIADAKTGISIIDKMIDEFYETGYLHNHVRMYIAGIACNIGKAHWSAPAQWMYYYLLDGDLASNTCSWQWVTGAFSSKKYYCNQENINRYTHSHQINTFLDTATENLPGRSLPDVLKPTLELQLNTLLPDISKPDLDISKPTLIYNSYNLDPLWRKEEDVNRVLLLEPSFFRKFPVSGKVVDFILALSKNIPNIKWMVGEIIELAGLYKNSELAGNGLISKEHPAFTHYPGLKDERDWMYPEVSGYYPSFFSYWKKCSN
jgi:deoxyribodipyrimidine photo-lyase